MGDVGANAELIRAAIARARAEGAHLVVLPELSLPGYPAEDLYLKRHFGDLNAELVAGLAADATAITALVGFAEPVPAAARERADAPFRRPVHNSLAVLRDGRLEAVYRKIRLPNYGVFDEVRYFEPGTQSLTIEVEGVTVGVTICEDVWEPGPPASDEVAAGAALIVNASGSPYLRGKGGDREQMFAERARESGVPFAFCNLVGGQDELVFDGRSFVVDASGAVVARARQFAEDMLIWELGAQGPWRLEQPLGDLDEVYEALVLGLRDYVRKNGFTRVLLGLSGGIDSALVALIASDALGPAAVTCVVMPSPHSSDATQADARAIAANLGTELIELPIAAAMTAYDEVLARALER